MADYTREELEAMTVPKIKEIMRNEKVSPLSGKKVDIINRLLDALEKREEGGDIPDDEDAPLDEGEYTREKLMAMKVADLQDIMRTKNVRPITGKKEDLIARFLEAINGEKFVEKKVPASSFGEHLSKAQKRQIMKKPAGTDYKLRKMREEINDLANAGNIDDLNLAVEKVQGYSGFDKSILIAFVMQKNFELGNSLEDCLAILNEIVHYEGKLSYDELYDYLMPFFMGIFNPALNLEIDLEPLSQMFTDGLNFDTIIIAMARTDRQDLIQEFLEVTDVPASNIWEVLAKEVYYLMSIANLDRLDREL